LHVAQYWVLSLVHGGAIVQREQVLSHLCVKSYKASHALHMYFFAMAALMLIITLQCFVSALYSKYNLLLETEFPVNIILSVLRPLNTTIL